MRLKRFLGASVPLFLVLSVLPLGAGPAAAKDVGHRRPVQVDGKLVRQLKKGTGGVAAVVTARNRSGLAAIERLGIRGVRLRALPMILTRNLTLGQLNALKRSSAVTSVWANRKYKVQMEDTTWITKARYVWATSNGSGGPQGYGVTGKGVELAVIDTGIDGRHEDADNLIEFCETTGAVTESRMEVFCSPFNPASGNAGPAGLTNTARGDSTDDDGHGSHVSGTVAGTGHASGGMSALHSTIGMSPHAKLRVYSANVGPALALFEILSAYDDLTWKKQNGFNKVVAVNNSWGGGDGSNYDPEDPINVAINTAWSAGILSVFAAGNSGPEHDTLSSECVNPFVACIAASTKPDSIVMFSSRGRPSQVADTNRDGTWGGSGDISPDNHDWRLGQALGLGRYRPTIAAPGVNINSISANSATCREDIDIIPDTGCYEQLNGTSMATPHVTGAIGLIVQGYRQGHGGQTPSPNSLIDILERSANRTKLPAWESEEQGAGRLDVYEAVRFARSYPNGLPRPNLGHPTPPYVGGDYPKGPQGDPTFTGCTAAGSWSLQEADGNARYGQHLITVQPKTERLRITVRWDELANHYVRLWRPGVDPSADTNPAGPTRVFPDNEALGLLEGTLPFLGPERLIEVRSPEAGVWTLRVFNRVPDPLTNGCGETEETPQVIERTPPDGHDYEVWVEKPRVRYQPNVVIDSPAANAQTTGRWVQVKGRAGYPPHAQDPPPIGNTGRSWEGVTNWEVPGSSGSGDPGAPQEPDPDLRPVLYFHGNKHDAGEPGEANPACTGVGSTDVAIVGCGPYLLPGELSPVTPAAKWGPVSPLVNGVADRNIYDPNWTWCLAAGPGCPAGVTGRPGPTTVEGPMTVEWWASTNPACETPGLFTMGWTIRLWADGRLRFESGRIQETPALCGVPDRLKAVVSLPRISAEQRFVLQVDANELDIDQEATFVYYDSQNPCLGAPPAGPACDSLVKMPVATGPGGGGPPGVPDNVRVTDLPAGGDYPAAPTQSPALRVAWDPVDGATAYRVHRSTNPSFVPSTGNRIHNGAGQACPQGESPNTPTDNNPPGEERAGRCFTDSGVSLLTTYYYRVVAVVGGTAGAPSELSYGTPTRYDRQVKLKVDRLYGPQYWEYALAPPSPSPSDTSNAGLSWTFLWDTLELPAGPHDLYARSFTQGIGSQKAQRTLRDDGGGDGGPGPGPGCPDDDNGDGIDDHRDGDQDDDGDDDDDDCEDDDDDEEDDDD